MRSRGAYSLKASIGKLLLASLFLCALIAASALTSTPEKSPASTWITAVYRARYAIVPVEDRQLLETMHKNASKLAREQCVACHGDKTGSRLPLHRIHLTSDLLPGLACPDCHRSVVPKKVERTAKFSVRLIDIGLCKDCHSAFPGLQGDSPMKATDFDVDCTTCHTGKSAYKHQRPYLSHVIPPKKCKGCHGGRVLPWTPKHETADWLQVHGPEALRVGEKSCFRCHEFGLAFCEDCHKHKPQSHRPREQWLASHVDRARADTRACFACHKATFCKKCHVNHEADWLKRHPSWVEESGTKACVECHSLTFCSYCHIRQGQTE